MSDEDRPVHNFQGGTVNMSNPTFSHSGTGENVRVLQPNKDFLLNHSLLFLSAGCEITGHELLGTSAFLKLLVPDELLNYNVADYYTAFEVKHPASSKHSSRNTYSANVGDTDLSDTPAGRLRTISGLNIEQLTEIFQVSRPTYYKWMSGSIPHGTHREHLLEVLPLVEEVFKRLSSRKATSDWLLTPVIPNGKKPADYLKLRQYSAFRGFLLRARTGQETIKPLTTSRRIHHELSREEVEDALERLSPKAWKEDFITDETNP